MDVLLFLLILTVWYGLYRQWSKTRVASLCAAAAVVTVLLLNRQAAASLDLGF